MNLNLPTCNLAIFVSGSGSNLQAIIDKIESRQLNAQVSTVISDVKNAYALERAKKHRLPCSFIDPCAFSNKSDYELALISYLSDFSVDLIILAGFMRILGETFVSTYSNRILNIHPSLLPKYKGLHTHQRALDNNDEIHGATVHVVNDRLDDGPIVLQKHLVISKNDDASSLQHRVQNEIEYDLYSSAIQRYWSEIVTNMKN